MNICKSIWLVPLLGVLAMPVFAGPGGGYENRLEQRIDRQHDRIRHGIRSGELTRWEAKKLRKQHRRIVKLEDRYMRDGRLDRYERRKLANRLDRASERIRDLKHNDYRRSGRDHHRPERSSDADRERHGSRYSVYFPYGWSFEQWQADNG
jgi:hypothetical protein